MAKYAREIEFGICDGFDGMVSLGLQGFGFLDVRHG